MKKFTIEEVKTGLEYCERNDCDGCPFECLPMIDCEIALLGLARQTIETYETEISKSSSGKLSKRRNRRK